MIHISANESNVGDWMSAIGIRRLLGNPPMEQLFCDEYFLPETLPRLAQLGRGDHLIIGGGGLFQEYFAPFWRGVAGMSPDVRFYIWGVGLCAEHELSASSRALIRDAATRARICIVRDEMTRRFLDLPNIPPPVPCPSVVAAQQEPGAKSSRRGLLHAVHYDLVAAAHVDRVRQIVERFAARTDRACKETDNCIEMGDGKALRAVIAKYVAADLVVSSRLHGCILGLSLGCKVLALSADPKVAAFMQLAGLGDRVCRLDDYETIERRLPTLENQPRIDGLLDHAAAANRNVAEMIRNESIK